LGSPRCRAKRDGLTACIRRSVIAVDSPTKVTPEQEFWFDLVEEGYNVGERWYREVAAKQLPAPLHGNVSPVTRSSVDRGKAAGIAGVGQSSGDNAAPGTMLCSPPMMTMPESVTCHPRAQMPVAFIPEWLQLRKINLPANAARYLSRIYGVVPERARAALR